MPEQKDSPPPSAERCGNCRSFDATTNHCRHPDTDAFPTDPTEWCHRWRPEVAQSDE